MPRIEIRPDWDEPMGKDGNPTIDVCVKCAKSFTENEVLDGDIHNEIQIGTGVYYGDKPMVMSVDVDHPSYDDDQYDCDCCGESLSSEDN